MRLLPSSKRQLKWRLQEIINEAVFLKKANVRVPSNLLQDLEDIIDQERTASLKDLQAKEAGLQNNDERWRALIKSRVENLQAS